MQASAKQQSNMTEAQLRAAASVTAKRANDEALHARQKLAELQQQLSLQVGVTLSSCIQFSIVLCCLNCSVALSLSFWAHAWKSMKWLG